MRNYKKEEHMADLHSFDSAGLCCCSSPPYPRSEWN